MFIAKVQTAAAVIAGVAMIGGGGVVAATQLAGAGDGARTAVTQPASDGEGGPTAATGYFTNATYYATRPVEQVSYCDIRENPDMRNSEVAASPISLRRDLSLLRLQYPVTLSQWQKQPVG